MSRNGMPVEKPVGRFCEAKWLCGVVEGVLFLGQQRYGYERQADGCAQKPGTLNVFRSD